MDDAVTERLHGLDLIRGLAVMGIALMNVGSFALPPAAYDNPAADGSMSPFDLLVWGIEFVFVDGKLRALFSILFGASLLLMSDRAEARGRAAFPLHVRRMLMLLLIGLAHALLIWPGDILVMYALAGLAAYGMREKPVSALVVAGLMCLVGQALISAAGIGPLAGPHAGPARAGHAAADAVRALALHLGPYRDLLADRIAHVGEVRLEQLAGAGLETIGLMLIGMAALRSGALSGAWRRRTYRRIALAAIAMGAAAGGGLLMMCIGSGFDATVVYAAAVIGGAPLRPLMALGYAAAVLSTGAGGLANRVRVVGRMALSCYISTSIVFALLFDGFGLGMFARLSRGALLLPVLFVWMLMLTLCPPWLRRFRHGPLEWLWRSTSHGTAQPFRRKFTIAT